MACKGNSFAECRVIKRTISRLKQFHRQLISSSTKTSNGHAVESNHDDHGDDDDDELLLNDLHHIKYTHNINSRNPSEFDAMFEYFVQECSVALPLPVDDDADHKHMHFCNILQQRQQQPKPHHVCRLVHDYLQSRRRVE